MLLAQEPMQNADAAFARKPSEALRHLPPDYPNVHILHKACPSIVATFEQNVYLTLFRVRQE
jgi:hypothetical protein